MPFASAANMVTCIGGGSICDEYNSAHDETPSQPDWIEGTYEFTLASTDTIQLELVWALREFDRAALGLDNASLTMLLTADGLDADDGAPADLIRSYFNQPVAVQDGTSVTVQNKLKQEVDNAIVASLATGFNTSNEDVEAVTTYVNTFSRDGVTIDCNYNNPGGDEFDEGAAVNNVFDPPICLKSQVEISISPDTFNLAQSDQLSLKRAYPGLLIMGTEITTKFDLVGMPGHNSSYSFNPPSYGMIKSVDSVDGAVPLWNLNHLGAQQDEADLLQSIEIEFAHRNRSVASTVDIPSNEKALDLQVTLDLRDESAAKLEFTIALHYLDETTMTDWGISLMSVAEQAYMPQVTSDGIRLAYHNGLVDLSNISDQFPINTLVEGISSSMAESEAIQMNPMTWVSDSLNSGIVGPAGGINYTHSQPDCTEIANPGQQLYFCLEGPQAMGYANPVYLQTSSQPFSLNLLDIVKQNVPLESGKEILDLLSTEDFQRFMNGGLEIETTLGDDFLSSIMPTDLPPSELLLELILPNWIRTNEGSDRIILTETLSGNNDLNISLSGTNQYDWRSTIKDDNQNILCKSTQKTCVTSAITIDAMEFDINEWDRSLAFEFALDASISMHRVSIPTDRIPSYNGTQISIPVIPSDLLRLVIDMSSRLDDPLARTFEFSSFCGSGEDRLTFSVCDENITFTLTSDGLVRFVERVGEVLTIIVHDSFAELAKMNNSMFSTVDVSKFEIQFKLDGLGAPDLIVGDQRGISLSVKIPKVVFKVAHDGKMADLTNGNVNDAKFAISTSNAVRQSVLRPMASAMQGVSQMLVGGIFDFISPQGVNLPATPGDDESVSIPFKVNSTLSDEFELAINGPLTIIMPPGLSFSNLESSQGNIDIKIVKMDCGINLLTCSRQQITYIVPAEGIDDTLTFRFQISWIFFFMQFWKYLAIIVILFTLAVRRRRKKKRKRKALKNIGVVRKTEKVSINSNEFADLSGFYSQGIHGDMDKFKDYDNKELPPIP